MNNQHQHLTAKRLVAAVVVAVVATVLAFVRYQAVIPTGTISAQAVLPVLLAAFLVLGRLPGALTLVLTAVLTLWLGLSSWPALLAWLVAVIAALLLEHVRFDQQLVLSHSALILLGLLAGLFQFATTIVIYALVGLRLGGSAGMRSFVALCWPVGLVNGLLTALLTAPLTMLLRWIMKHF